MKKLLLIGGGGHCHSVLDSVLESGEYSDIGIIDWVKDSFLGVPVIGNDEDVPVLREKGWTHAFITVGSVGNTTIRRRLYKMIKDIDLIIPSIIDSSAIVANGVKLSEGSFVGKNAVVNAGSILGICSIVNTGAIIEHDCVVGDFSHISPGGVICGQVKIGADSHVGAGAVIRQQITIGENSLIGMGSVVVKDIPGGVTAFGNPCKVMNR